MLAEQDNPPENGQLEPSGNVQTGQESRPETSGGNKTGRAGLAINWGLVRADYLRPDMSVQQVADKWGIKLTTLTKRVYRQRWNESRRDFRKSTGLAINQAVTQAVQAAKVAAQEAVTRSATEQASRLVTEWVDRTRQQAEKGVVRAGQFLDSELEPDDLRTVVTALDVADRVGRRALGLDREASGSGDTGTFRFALGVRLELISGPAAPDPGGPVIDVSSSEPG